jgi:hypothetical protein
VRRFVSLSPERQVGSHYPGGMQQLGDGIRSNALVERGVAVQGSRPVCDASMSKWKPKAKAMQ